MAKNMLFSVKTYYLTETRGHVRTAEHPANPEGVLLEERVVIFQAQGTSDAIRKAISEAKKYAAPSHTNVFGQRVVTKFTGLYEVFELFEEKVAHGVEVFSSTEVLAARPKLKALADRKLPKNHGSKESVLRKKFLNREFNAFSASRAREKK